MAASSSLRLLLLLASFVAAIHYTSGDCCGQSQAACSDCTTGDPCCGTGDCNVFCCGCDNGCRGDTSQCPARQRRGFPPPHLFHHNESDVHSVLSLADYDADGRLNFGEADFYLTHLKKAHKYKRREDLVALDLNHDGFLTIDEIDPVTSHVLDVDLLVDDREPLLEVAQREPEMPDGSLANEQTGLGQGGGIPVGETGENQDRIVPVDGSIPIGDTTQVEGEFVDIDTRLGATAKSKDAIKSSKT